MTHQLSFQEATIFFSISRESYSLCDFTERRRQATTGGVNNARENIVGEYRNAIFFKDCDNRSTNAGN